MKRNLVTAFLLLVLLGSLGGAPAVTAAPQVQETLEDSLINVWVFEDADRNGVYSTGDFGFTNVDVCVLNKKARSNSCVGTDQGDVWWEIREAGRFTVEVDALMVPPGFQLNSILCKYTRMDAEYQGCSYHPKQWTTKTKLPYGTRINVFYALVRAE